MANRAFHDQARVVTARKRARMAFKTTCVEQLFGVPQTIRKGSVLRSSDWGED